MKRSSSGFKARAIHRLLLLALCLVLTPSAQAARVALVIGNGAYQNTGVLANPPNDAADVAQALAAAGFEVSILKDAGKARIEQALAQFAVGAAEAEMAVVFYAGHGMELGGVNYLIPIDARLESEVTAPLQAIKLPEVMDIVATARLGIVFLDACRDNPLMNHMFRRDGTRTTYRGLARVEPQRNLQVVFAARDGSRAQDGVGRNSPFTAALLKGLRTPGLEIQDLWVDLREQVLASTQQRQEPYIYGPPLGRRARYYFLAPTAKAEDRPAESTPMFDSSAAEDAYWDSIKDSGNTDAILGYIGRYPQGRYNAQARQLLASLTRPPRPSTPPPVYTNVPQPSREVAEYQALPALRGVLSSVGSDTLNNLMTLWMEGFKRLYPNVELLLQGQGSSTAPPALADRSANLGPMARLMTASEIQAFEQKRGYKPTAIAVALDAVGVFVNKDNPVTGLSISQVDGIFSANRKCGGRDVSRWGDLGLNGDWSSRPVQLHGRNSVSGTYGYFKQQALCKGDFKNSVNEQPGSASVVQSVATNLNAIGYAGIGYKTSGVRALPLSAEDGGEPAEATEQNALSGKYPLARVLYIYVNKEPNLPLPAVEYEFLKMVFSSAGSKAIVSDGFIPLPPELGERELAKLR